MTVLAQIDTDGIAFSWDLAVQVIELDAGNGALNTDVAADVERQRAGEPIFEGARDCGDARGRLIRFNRDRILTRRACDRVLQDCGDRIIAALGGQSDGGLNPLPIRTMLDGQRLFNLLGEELLIMADGTPSASPDELALIAQCRNRLAAALELWFEHYRTEWLSIGRPAELDRIAHIVWSYADILRIGKL